MAFNVAVDGPAGAGKSTVAKAVAAKRNFIYVDTGAMYRAMALYFLRQGTDPKDEAAITAGCREVAVTLGYEGGAQQVYLNGENVTGQIRTEEVGMMASQTSAYGPVREKLTQLQKELARTSDVIMDGRDIGTCVLPQADVKVYLTASVSVRAKRRYQELLEKERQINEEIHRVEKAYVGTSEEVQRLLEQYGSTPLHSGISLAELIRRPELNYDALAPVDPERPDLLRGVAEQVNIHIKYDGYIRRQQKQVEQFQKLENKRIPDDLDYDEVPSLRLEARQKLKAVRPVSVGQASRISGVSPADISVLLVWLEQKKGRKG